MRIAYVTEWSPYEPSGVLKKIRAQVAAWMAAGENVKVFFVVPAQHEREISGVDSGYQIVGRVPQRSLDRFPRARLGYVNKIASAASLRRAVRDFNPDVIYFRHQGPWYPGLGRTLRLAPTVVELNGNRAVAAFWGTSNAAFAKMTDALWKRLATAYVSVSPEIADEYRDTAKPIGVIPNSLPRAPAALPPTSNEAPAFVFVGSVLAGGGAWHGIEKIIDLAGRLTKSRFEIVGLTRSDMNMPSTPDNVRFHGPKYGSELEAIYRRCDVGIGTLALHRRSMNVTSALKPLEYLAYGLPVVLGYHETEEALNTADYTLFVGNHEQNVLQSVDSISAFAERWRGKRVTADLTYLSSDTIERRRLDFLAGVL